MAEVYLNVFGDGTATTNALPPMVQGETFTIYFSPFDGATLDSVRAFDSHDYSVALPPVSDNQITMTWRSTWGNLYVDIYFSGAPEPPEPQFSIPYWLLFKTRKRGKNV